MWRKLSTAIQLFYEFSERLRNSLDKKCRAAERRRSGCNVTVRRSDVGTSLEKLYQRVGRFPRPLLEDPMTGVWQHDNSDIIGDQLHLCGQFIA
jgi:hypothetical protein